MYRRYGQEATGCLGLRHYQSRLASVPKSNLHSVASVARESLADQGRVREELIVRTVPFLHRTLSLPFRNFIQMGDCLLSDRIKPFAKFSADDKTSANALVALHPVKGVVSFEEFLTLFVAVEILDQR